MLKDRKAYEDKLDEQLAGWGEDLEAFMTKAKGLGVDGMIRFDHSVEAVKQRLHDAGLHLQDLKATGDDRWEHVKAGTDKIWQDIKDLFKSLPKAD